MGSCEGAERSQRSFAMSVALLEAGGMRTAEEKHATALRTSLARI